MSSTGCRSRCDVAILGSGFGGSLTAAILRRCGRSVVMLDRARHPRFAIGESSTPTANLILKSLAERYGLEWLAPLAKYGPWQRTYPQIASGLKRGFSYFFHEPHQPFTLHEDHRNELLVAASTTIENSDTQWLRADVDQFLFQRALAEGCQTFEEAVVSGIHREGTGWHVEFENGLQTERIEAEFLIDATGSGSLLSRFLPIEDETWRLKTHSRAVFAHFDDLPRWPAWLSGQQEPDFRPLPDHPWPCDDAALHHLLEEGWIWWLRFNTGRVSVGIMIDEARSPFMQDVSPRSEWDRIISRYPSLRNVFSTARISGPGTDILGTPRLQRLAGQAAGDGWAMLPSTAGFIDALHSTGIAHTLGGIERLTRMLTEDWQSARLQQRLADYSEAVRGELLLVDRIVSGCYAGLAAHSFRKFVCFSMAYFAAVTTWERRRLSEPDRNSWLFCADDPGLMYALQEMHAASTRLNDDDFERLTRRLLAPFNQVGLFAPPIPNIYLATSVPE